MDHVPVLRGDVQKFLDLKDGERVVDATLGLGGHAKDMVEAVGENGILYAFEQDGRNLDEAKRRLKDYEDQITYIHDNFCHLKTGVTAGEVDAILFDLGLSSPHVDDAERGFSFIKDGPLDMRFNREIGLTAADILNTYPESELADIFYKYGEERASRRVARAICERRKERKFERTVEFAEFMESVLPSKARFSSKPKRHPATQIFQALRIAVNDELKVLEDALEQAVEILKVGGRIVVISYHSLEDRIVKQFFKELERPAGDYIYSNFGEPIFRSLSKKPVTPGAEEISDNPRSRSAKLRAYLKLKNL